MTRLEILDGYFVDALPGGAWVAMRRTPGAPLASHLGDIPLYRNLQPLYVRCAQTGAFFHLAGQSSDSPQTLVWREFDKWQPIDVVACGVSPVIWDNAGILHISDCSIGSQGYRYVAPDNTLVTGDQTLTPRQAIPPFDGLSEWTALGDGLYVGQCNVVAGCAVWDGAHLRMVEPGDCFFIRATRVGHNVALAMVKHAGQPSLCLWLTVDELRAMPVITAVPPVIPPIAPFTHPVQVAAFKDPTGATGQPAIETFGVIVESLPPPVPIQTVRRIWIRDNDTLPYVPDGWRPGEWTLVEFYRRKTETLLQSVIRWTTDLTRTLRLWPYDVGVIPQLYCQGGAPPDELWTVQEVLDGLAYLSSLVNLDARIKMVAPFCYLRTNGMIAHPELLAAFYQIVAASPGTPTFVPLSGTHHPSVVLLT